MTAGSRCEKHTKVVARQADEQRGSSTERGYGYKWQQASKGFLRRHPLCQCPGCLEGEKRLLASTVVDHKIPPRLGEAQKSGDSDRIAAALELFWNRDNWQAMSKPCHDHKTATQDGGFSGHPGGHQKSTASSF